MQGRMSVFFSLSCGYCFNFALCHLGIAIAKDEGKYKGCKPLEVDEMQFKDVYAGWRAGEITATAAMKEPGLKPNVILSARKRNEPVTAHNHKEEMRETVS